MIRIYLSFFFLMAISTVAFTQTDESGSFEIDDRDRNYRVHLPPNFDSSNEYPLVINMHGLTSNAVEQQFYSDVNRVSDANNFIVCYPNGVQNSWNSGFGTGVDDVKFLDALIDTLDANYNVDLSRVYSTGMSNGGFMSYKLACELSERIAAIASVTGSMTLPEFANCDPVRVVPVMQIHGTNDATVPFEGNAQLVAVETMVEAWVAKNGCDAMPEITPLDDFNTTDDSTVELLTYSGCGDEPRVEFYKVDNGGHTWPGSPIALTGLVTNYDFRASDKIWEFFSQFQNEMAVAREEVLSDVAVEIFPNPATDLVQINTDLIIENVLVFNVNGQLVQTFDTDNAINIRSLAKGLYWLKIQTAEGVVTKKILKQ
ncbi:MAG: T9SS type A sorting domain-containing protein [Saprospiraceae bacterium]